MGTSYNTFPTTNHLYKFKNRSSSELDSRKVLPNRLRGSPLLPCSNNEEQTSLFACPSLFLAQQASILLTPPLQSSIGSFTRSPSPTTSHRAAGWRSMCTARTKWWGDMRSTGCDGAPLGLSFVITRFPFAYDLLCQVALSSSKDRSTESGNRNVNVKKISLDRAPRCTGQGEMKTGTENTLPWGPTTR